MTERRAGAGLTLEAHAKINLTLEVIGKRDDGFHDLASVMQTVSLYDTVALAPAADLSVACDDDSIQAETNLALVAARALQERAGVRQGAHIEVKKRIPVAAGLGGGSSDAAAVLVGLNRMWNAGLGYEELAEVAAEAGSDVPFFLTGGTALVRGRGEEVVALPPANVEWLVILAPEIALSGKTGVLFSRLGGDQFTRGVLTHKLAGRIRGGGDVPAQFLFNVFNDVAPGVFHGWDEHADGFLAVGAREIMLCGAGPAMFALAPSREIGLAWQLMMERQRQWRAYLVRRWDPPLRAAPGRERA